MLNVFELAAVQGYGVDVGSATSVSPLDPFRGVAFPLQKSLPHTCMSTGNAKPAEKCGNKFPTAPVHVSLQLFRQTIKIIISVTKRALRTKNTTF